LKSLLLRWLKFSAVGWLGVGVQLTALTLLAGHTGLHYLAATVLAVEAAILHNFFWHERWTWGDRGLAGAPGRSSRLVRFNFTTGLVSILGNVVFMRLFVGALGLHYLVGNLASIASCAIANFLVSDRIVFLSSVETEAVEETLVEV
jgi:putative flippase GtrA